MIELQDRPGSLLKNFDDLKGLLSTVGPESVQALRQRSLEAYRAVGIPTRKDEEFKYLPLGRLAETDFQPAYGATVDRASLEAVPLGDLEAATLAFVNGEYAPEISTPYALPEGVVVCSLQEALESGDERAISRIHTVAPLHGKLGSSNDTRFADLNAAYLADGAFVFVPKGVAVRTPIHLVFLTKADHGPLAAHPRALIVIEEGGEAKVVESYVGVSGEYFNNSVSEVVLGPRAILEHTKVQIETSTAVHIATIAVHQETESVYTGTNVSFGGSICRNDINAWVDGEHCETWLNGAYVGNAQQLLDNHTRIDHAKPNCRSFEVYKGILADRSVGVFNGKIFVYEDAQKTDAKQTNQAILLGPNATVNTKPQLEIFADDVKCTHGATVGRLSAEATFYLRSRGLPEPEARAMLVVAFAAEAFQRISIAPVRETLERLLTEKLNRTE